MQTISEQVTDKTFLRSIVKKNYAIPANTDAFVLAKALLANLSSTDEELRDELSYMILASGIIDKDKLSKQQLADLLALALDRNHLFYHIGEVENDSVFMRSFSSLIVAAILYVDAKEQALSERTIQQTKADLLLYAREEKDWRGYVRGKGWAHAMAHLADTLDVCAQNPHHSVKDQQQILELVKDLAQVATPLYHEEDMRLATVAYHIIACKEVGDEFLSRWLNSCFVVRDPNVTTWRRASNMKNFLRSLYFLLFWNNIALSSLEQISSQLKRLDAPYVETDEDKA